jgi:hypothetical protein
VILLGVGWLRASVFMFLVLIIGVPIALFLVWGIAYDVKQRRRNQPSTDHDPDGAARRTRRLAEGKGSEWGTHG